MAGASKDFRDFGVGPVGLAEPPGVVRAVMPAGHVFGQYLFTGLMSLLGVGLAALFGFTAPFPVNLLGFTVPLLLVGFLVYFATRNDYRWVELDGRTIRARHLYTGRVVERDVSDVSDVLTLVFVVRNLTTRLTEHWLGRVRGVMIRFGDGRTPLMVCRADPKMRNAQELIEALLYRLAQRGDLDFEVTDLEGQPLLRRVFPKAAGATSSPPA